MRVVFMGYQTWGHRVLEALIGSDHEVPLVLTHPTSDHPYETIWNDSVADLAAAHGIPVIERNYANDSEVVARVGSLAPDILVSSDWRTWVAPDLYKLARYGAINVHDALLPRYGGFAPLNWALVNGEREVGVTAHFMNEEFDLGDIVVQRRIPVDDNDNATDLFHKTIVQFAPITLEALALIGSGRTEWIKQDPGQATFFHKRSAEDSRIDWKAPAARIANLVRAQADPYPNAFAYFGDERVRVLEASVSQSRLGGTPGRIFRREGGGVAIVCGPGSQAGTEQAIVLGRLRTDDGREIAGAEFFRQMGGYLTSHPQHD
jgi:methionyl-tRNA formyltransferase